MSNFYARTMNIQSRRDLAIPTDQTYYAIGHQEARHAAAVIAMEADRRIEELEAFIKACLDCTSAEEVHDFLVNNWETVMPEEE